MSGRFSRSVVAALLLTVSAAATAHGAAVAHERASRAPAPKSSVASPVVPADPDLTINVASSAFTVGSTTATYTLGVDNVGNATASGTYTITDTLPVGVTYTSASGTGWTASWNAGTRVLTATRTTSINKGKSAADLILTLTIDAAAYPSVTNRAWISGGGEVNTANNSASLTTAVTAVDLAITNTSPTGFGVGINDNYTIGLTNNGTAPTTGTVTVRDTLPAGMTYVSATGSGWTISGTGSVVVATTTTAIAANGGTSSFTVTVSPQASAIPSATTRAWVSAANDINAANDMAANTTPVSAVADITISETPGTLSQYLPASYTVTVTNNGTAATSGTVTVIDTLPALFTFSGGTGSGWTFTSSGQVVTAAHAAAIAGGTSSPFTINADVGMAAASATNTVYVSGGNDATPGNNSATNTSAVTQRPNFIVFDTITGSFAYNVNDQISLNIYNSGNAPSFGTITMVDTLPVGIAYVSNNNANWSVSYNAATRVVTATSSIVINAGVLMTPLVLTVSVGAAAYPSVTNRLWVTGGGDVKINGDGSTTVVTAPDLALTLTAPSGFVQGVNDTYSYGVANIGTATTTGTITVRDTLPTGMTYVSGTGSGWTITGTSNVVVATRTTAIAANGSAPFTVTVAPQAAAIPSVTNKAVLTNTSEVIASNDTSIVTTSVTSNLVDLALTKTASAFTQFSTGTYTFSITNSGNTASSGTITIVDTLPAGVSFTSGAGTGWTYSASGQVVTASYSNVIGISGSTTGTLNVAIGAAAASITNRAYMSGGGDATSSNNTGSVTSAVTQRPDISPTVTSSTPFTNGANNETYSIVVANNGGATTSGTITLTDTLPAGVTYVSRSGNNWTVSYNSGTRVVTATNNSTINAGANAQTLALTVSIAAAAYPSVTNTVWVSGGNDANATNNSGSTVATVLAPDLSIAKTAPPTFAQGVNSAYTITLTNVGTASTSGTITVRDTLPVGMTYVSAAGTGWTISGTGNVVVATSTTAIVANGTSTFTINVAPQAAAIPSVTNKAVVTGGGDVSALNDTSRVTTTVTAGNIDLSITNTSPTFAQFSSDAYTVTVSSSGTLASSGTITVVDTLPAGVTFTSASGAGWSITNSGQVVTATYAAAIATGNNAAFTINVSIGAAAASITARAWLSGGGDASVGNNTGTATTTVTQRVDLSMTKTSSSPFNYGSTTETYTLVAHNNGGASTSGTMTITDTLPAGMAYVSRTGTNWTVSYNAGTRVVTATSATAVASGANAQTLVLTVSVGAAAYPSITNTAWISGGGDVDPSNNSASTLSTVNAPDLTVSATTSPATFSQGSNGIYNVTVSNIGGLATSGTITVIDTLPAGMTYSIATGTNWTFSAAGGVVTATSTTSIAANGTSTFTLAANPGAGAVPQVTNRMIVSGGNEIQTSNNTTTNTTTVTGTSVVVDLAVGVVGNGFFQQGYNATYTVTVSNPGTAASGGLITVVDTLPTGITYVSASGSGWTVSANGQVVTATTSTSVGISGSAPFTITAMVGLAAVPSVTDRAWVSGGGDANSANNGSGNVVTSVSGIPSVTVLASSSPASVATPGMIVTYTYTFLNGGNGGATSVNINGPIPTQMQFQIGSVATSLPAGVTANVEYNNGAGWTYTPVSGGCSAPAGYDGCVVAVRWALQSALAGGATGNVSVAARVK